MIRVLRAIVPLAFFAMALTAHAKDPDKQRIDTFMIDASFGKVWSGIKTSMESISCGKPQIEKVTEPVDDEVGYKGVYKSDFCVIVKGEDNTVDTMEQYSQIPRIRNGVWINGRIQYIFSVTEMGKRQTRVIMKAELSGFEEFITNQIHFWYSNGVLEDRMKAMILAYVNKPE